MKYYIGLEIDDDGQLWGAYEDKELRIYISETASRESKEDCINNLKQRVKERPRLVDEVCLP